MINSREDFDNLGAEEKAEFIQTLQGTLWRVEKDDALKQWKAVETNTTIEKYGLTRADFPDATAPTLPVYIDVTQADLIAHAEQKAARLEASLASPLDNIMRNKTLLLHGKRAKSRPMSQAETDYLDALENDPRVLASVALLDAVMAIITDIKSGRITTTAQVEDDARWP